MLKSSKSIIFSRKRKKMKKAKMLDPSNMNPDDRKNTTEDINHPLFKKLGYLGKVFKDFEF